MTSNEVTNSATFIESLIGVVDRRRMPGVDVVEPHVPEDDGAEVMMVYLDNGKRYLVTFVELPADAPVV